MRRAVLLVLAAALLARVAGADRDRAAPLVALGAKALAAKDWAQARGHFQAAVKEEREVLAAHRGWAEAELGAGRKDEALAVLHAAVQEAESRDTLPREDVEPLMAMRRRLAELDPASAALEALLKKHGETMAALAGKYMTKDPYFAATASRAALHFLPDHAPTLDRLERLQKSFAGKRTALFNGKNLGNWMWAERLRWEVKDGVIVATMHRDAMVLRSLTRYDGDFDVVMEARAVEKGEVPLYFLLEGAYEGDDAYVYLGVRVDQVVFGHCNAKGREGEKDFWTTGASTLVPPVKPEDWNSYELQFSGSTVRALVNGKVVQTATRPPGRRGGYVAVKAQGGVIHFRKIEVVPR